jgi:hypothetical protein
MTKLDQGGEGATLGPGLVDCEVLARYVVFLEDGLQPPRRDLLTAPWDEFLNEMRTVAPACEGTARRLGNEQLQIAYIGSFDAAVGTFVGGVETAMILDGITGAFDPKKFGVVS